MVQQPPLGRGGSIKLASQTTKTFETMAIPQHARWWRKAIPAARHPNTFSPQTNRLELCLPYRMRPPLAISFTCRFFKGKKHQNSMQINSDRHSFLPAELLLPGLLQRSGSARWSGKGRVPLSRCSGCGWGTNRYSGQKWKERCRELHLTTQGESELQTLLRLPGRP